MEYPYKIKISSEDETINIAKEFVKKLNGGEVIVLNGNLGAGKTFFIKNALKPLEIKNVSSPTFALVNEYKGKLKVYHFDFYRLKGANELYDIGYNDYLNDSEALKFIEWGNLLPEVLPQKRIEISIELNNDFTREFEINEYE
jgi:tRNA threonylcarbamoyladenosine biosynthesis protein TsaE